MKRALVAIAALAMALAVEVAPAQADDRNCRGTIGAVHIDGNVIVPSGASCRLIGTRIDDNVEVQAKSQPRGPWLRVGGTCRRSRMAGGRVQLATGSTRTGIL